MNVEKSVERVIRLLMKEQRAGRTFLDCRLLNVVAKDAGIGSQADYDTVVRYMCDRRLIDVVNRNAQKAAFPNTNAADWLDSRDKARQERLKLRLQVVGLVAVIISALAAILTYYFRMASGSNP
jgi:hypothetical protein